MVIPMSDIKAGANDAYNTTGQQYSIANKKNGAAGGNGGPNSASSATLESHKSTTY